MKLRKKTRHTKGPNRETKARHTKQIKQRLRLVFVCLSSKGFSYLLLVSFGLTVSILIVMSAFALPIDEAGPSHLHDVAHPANTAPPSRSRRVASVAGSSLQTAAEGTRVGATMAGSGEGNNDSTRTRAVGPPLLAESEAGSAEVIDEASGKKQKQGGGRDLMGSLCGLFIYADDPYSSWQRFVVLIVFCIFSLSNAMQWLTYSPVPTQVRAFYGISTVQLNMLSTIYMIVYIALSLVSCLGLERVGLRWCLVLGTGLNFLGSLLKLVVGFPTSSYTVLLIAQFINSLSQIFVLSVPPTLAMVWYRESERGTATTVGSVANAVGVAIGMLVPPLWVKEGTDLAEGFRKLFGLQLGLCAFAFVGAVLFVPTPTYRHEEEGDVDNSNNSGGGAAALTLSRGTERDGEEGQMRVTEELPATSIEDEANTVELHVGNTAEVAEEEEEEEQQDVVILALEEEADSSESPFVRNPLIAQGQGLGATLVTSPSPFPSPAFNEHLRSSDGRGGGGEEPSPTQALLLASPENNDPSGTRGTADVSPVSTVAAPVVGETTNQNSTVSLVNKHSHQDSAPQGEVDSSSSSMGLTEIFKALGLLIIDRDSLFCELGLSVSIGSVWAVNSLLAQLLAPINVSESDAGQMGFWNIIAGTIIAVIVGPLVDKFRVYKYPIIFLAVLNLVCLSFIIMIIYIDDTVLGDSVSRTSLAAIYALNVIAGVPQNVITPVGFEFLMELSFGHPGSISGGLLMGLANTVSLIEVSVGSEMLGDDAVAPKKNALNAFWFIWALLIGGLVLLVLPRNNLKRLAAQKRREGGGLV